MEALEYKAIRAASVRSQRRKDEERRWREAGKLRRKWRKGRS